MMVVLHVDDADDVLDMVVVMVVRLEDLLLMLEW
jgi:hypothetical protein